MKMYRVMFAASMIAGPTIASADDGEISYGWCEVKGTDGNYLMSGLLQHVSGPDRELNEAFAASVGSDDFDGCRMYYSSPSQAKSERGMRQYVIQSEEKLSFTVTGWTGKYGITGESEKEPSGPYLSVTKAGRTAAEVAAERIASELEGQKAAAAANAKRVADAARNEANMKVRIAKYMEELKRRGNAQ